MWFRSKLLRVVSSFVFISSLASWTAADTIRLKDGSLIKGHIASFSGGKFVVEIGEGSRRKQMTFAVSEIESITFDPATPAFQATRTTSLPAVCPKPEQRPASTPKVVTTNKTVPTKTVTQPPRPSVSGSKMTPISWTTKVLADNTANGWTNSGWVVKKGQRIRITGDGNISLGKGRTSTPEGNADLNDDQKLMKSVPTGALIAVIGDDNNDFIYVGAEREFTAARDGALFLGVNEGNLNDNSGAYNVKIEILPS